MKRLWENSLKREKIFFFISIAIFVSSLFFSYQVVASTNIYEDTPPTYLQWAWNDYLGWIDFYATDSVVVEPHQLQGFARYSKEGDGTEPWNYISMNCLTGPGGTSCVPINYKVSNDGDGVLTGWAWSDAIGWISFNCGNAGTDGCAGHSYYVKIVNGKTDPKKGEFEGFAWNDVVGWISFNCSNPHASRAEGICDTLDYKVKTSWFSEAARGLLTSSTFDTGEVDGAAYNYILWKGSLNSGAVRFQFATSNCANGATDSPPEGAIYPLPEGSPYCDEHIGWGLDESTGQAKTRGDGAFLGPAGTSGAEDLYNPSGPDSPTDILNQATHNNRRFFRYKLVIDTNLQQTSSPEVTDVIVNWSP